MTNATAIHPANAVTADALLKKYATQLTAALAVVISITGVMMFFSLYKREVEAMHEWLGMGFVVAVALHLARHRRPVGMMLGQARMRVLMLITVVIAAGFLLFPSGKEGNPVKQTIGAVMRAPVSNVAPMLGITSEEALARLNAAGATNATPTQSIETIALASNTPPMKLLKAIVGEAK